MRVTYIGSYEAEYPRNLILIRGLRLNGVEVKELHIDIWRNRPHKYRMGPLQCVLLGGKLAAGYASVFFRGLFGSTDCLIVGYPGHFDVFFIKLLAILKRKPLFFDVFLSIYDTLVTDRGTISTQTSAARFLYWIDRTSCKLADHILLDTHEHIDYFVETFGIPRRKFSRILVGCNTNTYRERPEISKRKNFTVAFHGKCIPLQGVEVIVQAAGLLMKNGVNFVLVVEGQLAKAAKAEAQCAGITNIEWHGFTAPEHLARLELSCHIGLGIFGTTEKAQRVIPNKVFETVCMGLPLITGDSKAIRSIFTPERDCLMVPMGDASALAGAILRLRDDPELGVRLAGAACELYRTHWTVEALGQQIKSICEKNVGR